MIKPVLEVRDVPPRAAWTLEQAGAHPLLARLWAARGVMDPKELDEELGALLPPSSMLNAERAGERIAQALARREGIVVVADYDCDGATACAVALRGLAMLGADPAHLRPLVPDRRIHGYGLTPTIVDLALASKPQLLITVDNGVASFEGVAHARAQGLDVLVTDHHLPAMVNGACQLPADCLIVNPNQPHCPFESKSIAGVGVMFYVLLATRAVLRQQGRFDATTQPRLDRLLDLVALGTVADVVKLDANNRRLVAQGLKRMRAGRMQPGVAALFQVASRDARKATAADLGFAIAPRLNAAGRLADMSLGVHCLLADDARSAADMAAQLDAINRQRRDVEVGMRELAEHQAARWRQDGADTPAALTLFDPSFHEGVVGIVAGRLKDAMHRPTFVFARAVDGTLKGSGRSIAGFHLRDALDLISKQAPDLMLRFGGHAMAAGCTLACDLDESRTQATVARFSAALQSVASAWLDPSTLTRRLRTDGPLDAQWLTAQTVAVLNEQVWGSAFEAPLFCDDVQVIGQRVVADKHLKLRIKHQGQIQDAIWFGHTDAVEDHVRMAYRLSLDDYQGPTRVQMIVEAVEALSSPTAPIDRRQ